MRRLWATAASGAVILLSAGCSTEPATPAAAPAPASTPSVAASTPSVADPAASASSAAGSAAPKQGDAALGGNSEAICAQANRVSSQAAATFAADLKLLAEASTAKDPAGLQRAKAQTDRDVQSWAFALKDMSGLATEANLKKALADMSAQVTTFKGDVQKIDEAKLVKLHETLDKACGKA
jgi:hypothetical protein